MIKRALNTIALLILNSSQYSAFDLPGVTPHTYKEGDLVPLHVNSLTPNYIRTDSSQNILPYEYYDKDFGFCKPEGGPVLQSENLGGILFGDRIYNSPFEIKMLKPKKCEKLCKSSLIKEQIDFLQDRIKEEYGHNWLIDDLPVVYRHTETENNPETETDSVSLGFPLGERRISEGPQLLNNHFDITIYYHTVKSDLHRVVKAEVEPRSIEYKDDAEIDCHLDASPLQLSEKSTKSVTYSYSVKWKHSEISWATRWDSYLKVTNSAIHWFSLINSSVIVLFLSGMIAMILFRTLYRDIARYNQIDTQEDIQEEYGWKLIHGDVFRTPYYHQYLCVFVGSGCQIFCMAAVTLLFAVLGFLSPSNRGSLVTALVTTFMLFGSVSGFVSARLYKMFGGENWRSNMIMTAFLFPGFVFSIFIVLNFFLLAAGSSAAVPAGTIFGVVALWFLISAPLSFAGGYFGFKKPRVIQPVKTNQIPRQIPDQPLYLKFLPTILVGGILPFGAIFIELYLIMNSLWFHKLYYVFGFLFVVFVVLSITCAEITILLAYFHLCSENYNWWWRSFLTSGTTGFYAFLYSVIFFISRLKHISAVSAVIYFGWAIVTSAFIFILTGTIGFLSCLIFIRRIYGSIKID